MYLTVKQQVKHLSKEEYAILKDLCHTAKNLANEAIYNVRQYYFENRKYLRYEENYKLLKSSENYRRLNSNMAQQILKEVDGSFRSFFGLLKLAEKGQYSNSYRKDHRPVVIHVPPILSDKAIKEIRIIPKAKAGFFEIQYTYEAACIERNLNRQNALALDPGVNNLVTAVSGSGRSFIIDGKRLKSINQWYNKENARLQSIKDKQHFDPKMTTDRQKALARKRNNRVNDYMAKAARKIIDYCIENDIGTLVCGINDDFQRNADLGKRNNQTFVGIPYGKLTEKLSYLCEQNGIDFHRQEESYTSKASFFDGDSIPEYGKSGACHTFSGKRIHRGMYRTASGRLINADVNGALNILKKSNVVSPRALYSRGEVDTPVRIRIA